MGDDRDSNSPFSALSKLRLALQRRWQAASALVRRRFPRKVSEIPSPRDALSRSEAIYRLAIENTSGVPYRLRYADHHYEFIGAGFEALLGYPAEGFTFDKLRGIVQEIVVMEPGAPQDPYAYGEAFRQGKVGQYRVDLRILTPHQGEKWLSDCAISVRDEQTGAVIGSLGILQDITQRKRTEEALRQSNKVLATLNAVAQATSGSLTPDELCDRLVRIVRDAMPCDAFTIELCDVTSTQTRGVCSFDTIDGRLVRLPPQDIPLGPGGPLRCVFEDRQPLLIHRTGSRGDPLEFVPFGDTSRRSASLLFAPLVGGDRTIGIVSAQSYTPEAYTPNDLALLEAIAHQIGPAVEAALLSKELRESQVMLQSTIESLPFDFFAIDSQGRYILQNSACREHWGDVLGKRPSELPVSEETRALWQRNNKRAFAGETVEGEVEYTLGGEKGYYHNVITPMHADGRIRGILGLNIDITRRKRAELERAQLATAIEQAAEIIFMTDPEGHILYVNPAFTRITGYPADEVLGRNLRALDRDHPPDSTLSEMWDALRHGRTWHGRLAAHRKDGSPYEVERTISPVRDASGTVVNFVSVDRDVTKEVEMEAQLRQAQKMEAIGQLAGGVAHDFNNLLQGILGHIDLALDSLPSEQEACEDLRQARQAAEKAVSLTRQLLAFGRRQILQAKNLDLNQVIGDLIPILRRLVGEIVELDIVPGAGLWTVHADPGQMEQVLINLCVNARDAMAQGGTITVRTENSVLDADAAQAHPWAKAGRYVLLAVTDTGLGMAPYVQDHVFEPFFTTKEVGKGTGLGLATVYGIIKQHAGYIEVDSQPGRGSTFQVYLPAVNAPPDPPETDRTETLRGGSETVLVAEDDPLVRNLTARILEGAGYTVLRAKSGEEAVRLFESHADEVALLLLDVVMPKLSGVAAFERIRAIRPDARVLFSSGYGARGLRADFVPRDRLRFIQKPYRPTQLLQRVRQLLDRS